MEYQPPGKWFDDFEIGQEFRTVGRTITETDIINFAGLSGDFNQLHTDREFAKKTPFGQPIAHGMLVASIATGAINRLGVIEGTAMAFLGLAWQFLKPVLIGDTVSVLAKVKEKKETKHSDRGIVVFSAQVLNQSDEVVQEGQWTMMMRRRV